MMLSWKTAACLAAGNTVVIKPAQVSTHSLDQAVSHEANGELPVCQETKVPSPTTHTEELVLKGQLTMTEIHEGNKR